MTQCGTNPPCAGADPAADASFVRLGREGNSYPLFILEILTVRDATKEETMAGGAIHAGAGVEPSLLRPV
jgi:hypothetical protein